jgi:hypothetical protein
MTGVLSLLGWGRGVRWACRAGTGDFCSALAALVGLVQNVCFLTMHYFNSFVPLPSTLGRKPYWVACLLVFVSVVARPSKTSSLCLL